MLGHDAHKESVFCIDHNNDGSLVCSGAGDVTVKVVSTVNGKVRVLTHRFENIVVK